MIDLHCHLLPGIDDGAEDLETALAMARIAVADGITLSACTPHIYPGLYQNDAVGIRKGVDALRLALHEAGIPLAVTTGADIQLVPELVARLRGGAYPSLHGSRYFNETLRRANFLSAGAGDGSVTIMKPPSLTVSKAGKVNQLLFNLIKMRK